MGVQERIKWNNSGWQIFMVWECVDRHKNKNQ